jgi:hypothetical protein
MKEVVVITFILLPATLFFMWISQLIHNQNQKLQILFYMLETCVFLLCLLKRFGAVK